MEVKIMRNVLDKNQDKADENKKILRESNVIMLNLISSPGAGKTTILESLCNNMAARFNIGVIEGDAYTDRDAQRLAKFGFPVVQINTEGGCHLDSFSINKALGELPLEQLDIVVVENVGNLICPTSFDLGESYRVAILSTTEGDDKPAKYPMVLRDADIVVLNKTDLLEHTNFNLDNFKSDLRKLNPLIPLFEVSAIQGHGMEMLETWVSSIILGTK